MAIKRPDIYEHNNPNLPIVDSDFVKGGVRSAVQNLSDLYALTSKSEQLKQHSTQIYVSGENKIYLLKDINNIGNANGWEEFNFGGGESLTNIVYTTGSQTISGSKNFKSRPTYNSSGLLILSDLDNIAIQISGLVEISGDIVYLTGDQTISGLKDFTTRPTVNGSGVLLESEAAQLPTTIVYTTGDQTISGIKTFETGVMAPFLLSKFLGGFKIDLDNSYLGKSIAVFPDTHQSLNWGTKELSGQWKTNQRLLVNNTGVLLSGEAVESNGTITRMIRLTQAQYNTLSPKDPTTFYVIVG